MKNMFMGESARDTKIKKRVLTAIIIAAMMASVLTACSVPTSDGGAAGESYSSSESAQSGELPETQDATESGSGIVEAKADANAEYFSDRDLSGDYDESSAVKIACADSTFTVDGSGASVKDNVLTITEEGVYILSGTIKDGRIVVAAEDTAKVQLVLNGCSITCGDYAPIYVKSADKVFITLAGGTKNTIADGKSYASDSEESSVDAAIFSKSDLVINGSGELTVNGSMSHAIVSKDDLKITGGTLTVTSVDSAVSGKDSVRIANADITVTSGGDGVKATNDTDSAKGYIYIESGKLTITCANDALQAESDIIIKDGTVTGMAGGGSSSSTKTHEESFGGRGMFGAQTQTTTDTEDSESTKGIKAGGSVYISGGTVDLNCADDTLNVGGSAEISGGKVSFASGDDGIHADGTVTISGGELTISESYEGIEGYSITVSGGKTSVTASDDGINATDGVSEGGMPGMGGMMGQSAGDSDVFVLISGGELHVNAGGDGLDSNGVLKVTGGTVYVDGPTNSGNGALDSGSGATITGGTIIAVGSSGMAESFGSSSTQASILYNMSESHSAGEKITLKDSGGKVLAEYTAAKTFNSVVISTPELKSSGTYTLTVGSSEYTIEMTGVSYSNGGMGGGMGGGMRGSMGDMGGMDGEAPGGMGGMGGRGGRMGGMFGDANGGTFGTMPDADSAPASSAAAKTL